MCASNYNIAGYKEIINHVRTVQNANKVGGEGAEDL